MKKHTLTCLFLLVSTIFLTYFISQKIKVKNNISNNFFLESIEGQLIASFDIAAYYAKVGASFIVRDPNIIEITEQAYNLHNKIGKNKKLTKKEIELKLKTLREKIKKDYEKTLVEDDDIVQIHLHIHNKDDSNRPISFFRFHQSSKTDFNEASDYLYFRKKIIALHQQKEAKPVSGIEVGVGGLGIRGIAPIIINNKLIGSFEFGMNHTKLIKDIETATKTSIGILLNRNIFGTDKNKIPLPYHDLKNIVYGNRIANYVSSNMKENICDIKCNRDLISEITVKKIYEMENEKKGSHYSSNYHDIYINPFNDANGNNIGFIFIMNNG